MGRASSSTPRYKPHPILERRRADEERLKTQTGRSFRQWVTLARARGPARLRALAAWLRQAQGLESRVAYAVASAALDPDADPGDPARLVDALYSGERTALRPLHEALVDELLRLGDDVTVTACKTMVPAYRKHVFAELSPGADAVRLRMSLGATPFSGRLHPAAGRAPDDRLSHEVRVHATKEIDATLQGWLQQAYALGAARIARSTAFEVPPDLARSLARARPARTTWDSLTPAMKRDLVAWIQTAKQAATRERRLATALAGLQAGRRRIP